MKKFRSSGFLFEFFFVLFPRGQRSSCDPIYVNYKCRVTEFYSNSQSAIKYPSGLSYNFTCYCLDRRVLVRVRGSFIKSTQTADNLIMWLLQSRFRLRLPASLLTSLGSPTHITACVWGSSIDCGGRNGGLMVSALDSGSSGPGSGPGWRHCVVFLGETLYSHGASLHPGA